MPAGLTLVQETAGARIVRGPERTVGDELQAVFEDAHAVLATTLALTRASVWSVGIGVGRVEWPLPESVRAGRGAAFFDARDAVTDAKRASTRVRLCSSGAPERASDAEALLRLLIDIRDRRTDEGWEVYDLLAAGNTQRDAASTLGISAAAVSLRARAASLRLEEAAVPALERLLADVRTHAA